MKHRRTAKGRQARDKLSGGVMLSDGWPAGPAPIES
jgi:hypothetical protein